MKKAQVFQLANLFAQLGEAPQNLISLSCGSSHAVAFHAAWVLEVMLAEDPEKLDYYLIEIIDHLSQVKDSSVLRHFTKLINIGLTRIVNKKTFKIYEKAFWKENTDFLEEFCLQNFLDADVKSAVKVNCIEILYLLSSRKEWLAKELPSIIERYMECGSPSVKARCQDITRRMVRQRKFIKD